MSEEKTENNSAESKISGHVYSKSGAILKGAKIRCGKFRTIALADGFYVFNNLHSGTFEVNVSLKGFKSENKKVTIRNNEITTLDFLLSKASGTAKIRGCVYDSETNKPIANKGSVILILPISNRYAPIVTDGYYELSDLPKDTYTIYTSIPEYYDSKTTITLAEGESKKHDFSCIINRTLEPPLG